MAAAVLYTVIIATITAATGQQVVEEPKVYSYPSQTVNLSCVVNDTTGSPISQVTWLYGTGRIVIATFTMSSAPLYPASPVQGRVSFSPSPPNLTSPSIQISDIRKTDEGNYTCSVALLSEDTTYLEVLEKIVDASVTPSTNQPVEGNSVNLTCEAAGSVFTRKWMKNGTELTESDNMMFYNEGRVLTFLSLNKTDSGEYSCNISNPLSSVKVQHIMDVIFGPENVQIQGPSNLTLNEILTLTCFAESTPPPTFTWKLNERASSTHSAVLKKRITGVSDSGKYICEVMNSVTGRNSSAVHKLTVTLSPDKPSPPCPAGCIAGIVISCVVLIAVCVVLFVLYKKKHSGDRQKSQRGTDLQQRNSRDSPPENTEQENGRYQNVPHIYESVK